MIKYVDDCCLGTATYHKSYNNRIMQADTFTGTLLHCVDVRFYWIIMNMKIFYCK